MKNNIKFRIWDTKYNKFGEVASILSRPYKNIYDINDNTSNRFIFQQFTTLKDSNNKEIYDGDIIQWRENIDWYCNPPIPSREFTYIGVIKLDLVKGVLLDIKHTKHNLEISYRDLYPVGKKIEVIGNIMENGVLLK